MQRGGLLPVVVFLLAAAGAVWYFQDEILRSFAPAPELTPIPAVVAAPARYDGKQVTVKGVVTSTSDIRLASGAGSRSYTLKEGAAELVVVPQDSLPTRGQQLLVTGIVSQPPRDKGLAPRLAESRRKPAPKS